MKKRIVREYGQIYEVTKDAWDNDDLQTRKILEEMFLRLMDVSERAKPVEGVILKEIAFGTFDPIFGFVPLPNRDDADMLRISCYARGIKK